ncbi:Angiotensin-converting enzyme [Lucilia cuprina]|nr:Angiotensin-converting enzyme [Lucilia cuprina]
MKSACIKAAWLWESFRVSGKFLFARKLFILVLIFKEKCYPWVPPTLARCMEAFNGERTNYNYDCKRLLLNILNLCVFWLEAENKKNNVFILKKKKTVLKLKRNKNSKKRVQRQETMNIDKLYKMDLRFLLLGSLVLFLLVGCQAAIADNELEVSNFLEAVNHRLAFLYNKEVMANWQNEIKGPNDLIAMLQSEIATQQIMRFIHSISTKVAKFKRISLENKDLKRQLDLIPEVGYEVLPVEDLELLYAVTSNMSDIYKNVKLCSFREKERCDLRLIPEVQNILHSTDDVREIEYYWLEWRRKTGIAAREDFHKFVELYRKTAKMNGFSKPSDFWHKDIGESSSTISTHLERFMSDLKPLFVQFHAYIRGQLRLKYGPELIEYNKPYPQQLAEIFIGNAFHLGEAGWSMDVPFNMTKLPNITDSLLKRGVTNAQINFWNAKEFFRSLGMPPLEENFWQDSCEAKADLEDDHCWHKAWSFYGLNHVNFSYCPLISEPTFFNMFEALSDVYYYRAYENLTTLYQEEPIPNLSDALGKFFSLTASSPKYLERLKLVDSSYSTKEARINRLYVHGLRTIFLIPVFYILERYRLDVIDKHIDINDNCAYWRLTEDYTGAEPPVSRSNSDFDAPAKLLMEVDDQYTTQIYSIVLQYQLLEHFCSLTGEYVKGDPEKPLDMCDLTGYHVVGEKIYKAMSLGSSVGFKDVLKVLVDTDELNINGLLEYYRPLFEWLKENVNPEDFVAYVPQHLKLFHLTFVFV